MKIIWFMILEIWNVTNRIFCHFGPFFAFYTLSPNNPQNQKFEKMREEPVDIIILHMCTIKEYGPWDMERDEQIILLLWTIFCPFTP